MTLAGLLLTNIGAIHEEVEPIILILIICTGVLTLKAMLATPAVLGCFAALLPQTPPYSLAVLALMKPLACVQPWPRKCSSYVHRAFPLDGAAR